MVHRPRLRRRRRAGPGGGRNGRAGQQLGLRPAVWKGAASFDTEVEIANPASVFCVEQGGRVEIVENDAGRQGICVLPDGTRVDEWEYSRSNATTVP